MALTSTCIGPVLNCSSSSLASSSCVISALGLATAALPPSHTTPTQAHARTLCQELREGERATSNELACLKEENSICAPRCSGLRLQHNGPELDSRTHYDDHIHLAMTVVHLARGNPVLRSFCSRSSTPAGSEPAFFCTSTSCEILLSRDDCVYSYC